jgi:hypothetical protein
MGKSLIAALVCCLKCILYPGIKICIAAARRGQSLNTLSKIIDDLMPKSANLRNEISRTSTTPSDASISFKNGSKITVVVASDSARSARAHMILADEFVRIKKSIIDTVLRKFKASQRRPDFYNKPEYKNYPKEPNTEFYISSAYYKYHYSWAKFKAFFKSMVKEESYCVLGFPYQLPVSEGYYPAEQIREEMQEDDWDELGWSMEMESLFYGESEHAFFAYDDLDNARKIKRAIYPQPLYRLLNDTKYKYELKQTGEIRVLTMDIATQGGKKNDATCLAVLQLLPIGDGQYIRNLIYITTLDGGHTFDQALKAKQLFVDLECDFIVVDTQGVGIGVFDNLVIETVDNDRNTVYPAWSCCNDESMAARCKDPNAPKIIYSIKANAQFNSDCAVSLRDCIKRGKFRVPIHEIDANEVLNKSRAYQGLQVDEQILFQEPYYQTSAFINEAVNLDYEVVNGKIRVTEPKGMRKDRYSAIAYGNAIANDLERDLRTFVSDYEYSTFVD